MLDHRCARCAEPLCSRLFASASRVSAVVKATLGALMATMTVLIVCGLAPATALAVEPKNAAAGVRDITGCLIVDNPRGVRMDLGPNAADIELELGEEPPCSAVR